jgi:hypothetical protein
LDGVLLDPRDPDLITHRLVELQRHRIYGLAAGHEDLNGHDSLRHHLVWQTASAGTPGDRGEAGLS